MSFPKTGELWFRFDPDSGEDKYVVVTDVKGSSVFCEYLSIDAVMIYPTFCRTVSDFKRIFTRKNERWV